MPIRVAMTMVTSSMAIRLRGVILTQTRHQSPISTKIAPTSTLSPSE